MKADDLFAGAGGWDLAAADLGIEARGVENMPAARATRDAAGLSTIHDDVWTFVPDGEASGLIASPPCQTFSQAGKGAGRRALDDVLAAIETGVYKDVGDLRGFGNHVGDERTGLVLTPLHHAVTGRYRWLAWEQVPTVLPVWEACSQVLRTLGWSAWAGCLHAEQYGVPQTRRRAFLIASRDHIAAPPVPTHSRYYSHDPERRDADVPSWVSMADALGWRIPDPRPDYFIPTNERPNVCRRPPEAPAPTIAFGHERPRWCYVRPATTVVGSFRPDVIAAPGYRTTVSRQNAPDSVKVTVAEAGILQSFPADYPWQGAETRQYLQAGNAVPPGLAGAVLAAATGRHDGGALW